MRGIYGEIQSYDDVLDTYMYDASLSDKQFLCIDPIFLPTSNVGKTNLVIFSIILHRKRKNWLMIPNTHLITQIFRYAHYAMHTPALIQVGRGLLYT